MPHHEAYLYPWTHTTHEFRSQESPPTGADQEIFTQAVTWLHAHS